MNNELESSRGCGLKEAPASRRHRNENSSGHCGDHRRADVITVTIPVVIIIVVVIITMIIISTAITVVHWMQIVAGFSLVRTHKRIYNKQSSYIIALSVVTQSGIRMI